LGTENLITTTPKTTTRTMFVAFGGPFSGPKVTANIRNKDINDLLKI